LLLLQGGSAIADMSTAAIVDDELPAIQPELYPNTYRPVVPNGKVCPVTGLKHGTLYRVLGGDARRHVRTVSLRQPGAARGKLLFHVGDMLRWLDGLAEKRARQQNLQNAEGHHAA
jgi:hypothetical protein